MKAGGSGVNCSPCANCHGHLRPALRSSSAVVGFLSIVDRHACRAARAGENRHLALAGFGSRTNHIRVIGPGQRKELARAARGEERRRTVGSEPFEALGISVGAKVALRVEVGEGKDSRPAEMMDLCS